jgi:Holliday junction resolvasome RuvABC endonuclease subunit
MIVLGCDLSYTRSGLVWLNSEFKVIRFTDFACKPGPKRLSRALAWFKENTPVADLAVIEDYAYGAPGKTVIVKLAELGSTCKVALEQNGIDYLTVSPSMIKKSITGKGYAEKHIVARELERMYKIKFIEDKGHDLSDAAACAVWGQNYLQRR